MKRHLRLLYGSNGNCQSYPTKEHDGPNGKEMNMYRIEELLASSILNKNSSGKKPEGNLSEDVAIIENYIFLSSSFPG